MFSSHAQNFYLLKIRLNLFEISHLVLKFENLMEIIIPFENLFQTWTPWSGAMCMCSSLSSDKVEHTHMAPPHGVHV